VCYQEVLKFTPDQFDAVHLSGVIALQKNDLSDAIVLISKALQINPTSAEAYSNRGIAYKDLHDYSASLQDFDRAIALNPSYVDALNNRGVALLALEKKDAALASFDAAITLGPAHVSSQFNRGNALRELGRYAESLASFEQVIVLLPAYAEAYNSRGVVLHHLNRFDAAVESYQQCINLNPSLVSAYMHKGIALHSLEKYDEALGSFNKAIELSATNADAYHNRGNLQRAMNNYAGALQSYERALELRPNFQHLRGAALLIRMQIANWDSIEARLAQLTLEIESGRPAAGPFAAVALLDSMDVQYKVAARWVQDKCPTVDLLPFFEKKMRKPKIRIGYFSADFHYHATAFLMAEMFELHDTSRFEIVAFSFGPDKNDAMRKRLVLAFQQFIDVRAKSDLEVAQMARGLEIDIAVDLKGHTQEARTGIFAARAAPLQVNYLGYPGTMAAPYIDYLIADRILVQENDQAHYSEKIVYLPDTYQVNDSTRVIAQNTFTRAELGLPESGFIFCSFNNTYKITPKVFDLWMHILKTVEGSVLWLLEDNTVASGNLKKEAQRRGIDGARLIFAPRVLLDEHLARHRAADLFLDTLPYNAHTTASDALWAGLPVLTCKGEAFASRVAASLLSAIGLTELITTCPNDYVALAIELATNAPRLHAIKAKLAHNRLSAPLFDTKAFTRNLEAAYAAMMECYHAGLPAEHLYL